MYDVGWELLTMSQQIGIGWWQGCVCRLRQRLHALSKWHQTGLQSYLCKFKFWQCTLAVSCMHLATGTEQTWDKSLSIVLQLSKIFVQLVCSQ